MAKMKFLLNKHKIVFWIAALFLALQLFGIGCLLKWFTGISCPGCGMTRALLSLFRLDWKGAFYYHPLFWLIPPGLLFVIHAPKPLFHSPKRQNAFLLVFLAIVLFIYLFRLFLLTNSPISVDICSGFMVKLYQIIKGVTIG